MFYLVLVCLTSLRSAQVANLCVSSHVGRRRALVLSWRLGGIQASPELVRRVNSGRHRAQRLDASSGPCSEADLCPDVQRQGIALEGQE